jgi:hypothetical protein
VTPAFSPGSNAASRPFEDWAGTEALTVTLN